MSGPTLTPGGDAAPDGVGADRHWWWAAARAVAAHPTLWVTAVVQVVRLARRGWWRRPPFLPVPDPAYLHFRLQTAYGDPDRRPEPADVVTYLHWCRAWPRVTDR